MGYQETTGATSRKIKMDSATVKISKHGRSWMQTWAGRGVGIGRTVQIHDGRTGEGETRCWQKDV